MRSLLSAVLVLAALASGCTDAGVEAGLLVIEGAVEVATDDGWVVATQVADGDRVRAVGDVLLGLGRGSEQIRLVDGTEIIVAGDEVGLRHGDVVITGDERTVVVGATRVDGLGTFRVTTGVAPRLGVYTGYATVQRPGEAQRVEQHRELGLDTRRLDDLDDPLTYSDDDAADRIHLAPAIALDAEVARYEARLTELYGGGVQPQAFYAAFTPVAPAEVGALIAVAPLRDGQGMIGPPAETLIGLFMARALAAGRDVDVVDAAQDIALLRAEGARWGLIALTLALGRVAFTEVVDQAVAIRDGAVPAAPAPAAAATASGLPASGGAAPPRPGAPAPTAATPQAPAPPAQPAPADPPSPPPPPGDTGVVPGSVQDLLEDVLDLAGGIAQPLLD